MGLSSGMPARWLVLDTETVRSRDPDNPKLFHPRLRVGWCVYHHRTGSGGLFTRWYRFLRSDGFWDRLDSLVYTRKPVYVFGHNLGFDLQVLSLWNQVDHGRYKLIPPCNHGKEKPPPEPVLCIDDRTLFIVLYRPDGQKFIFIDSHQILRVPLSVLGRSVGRAKLPRPGARARSKKWDDYCRRDVEILDRSLQDLWGYLWKNRCGSFAPTVASQAWRIWKLRFEKKQIVYHDDPEVKRLERQAYYSGRFECYRRGRIQGTVYQLDVNSLYPYIAYDFPVPVKLLHHDISRRFKDASDLHDPNSSLAEVWLKSLHQEFPIRCREGTLYVAGKVRTVLAGPELAKAVNLGLVHRVGRYAVYECQNVLRDCMWEFWQWLCRSAYDNRPDRRALVKGLMVGLLGKFGSRDYRWEVADQYAEICRNGVEPVWDCETRKRVMVRFVGGLPQVRAEGTEPPGKSPAIAAFITSYARIYMHNLIESAGAGHVFYQACDSLFVDYEGYSNLAGLGMVHDRAIGKLKLVCVHQNVNLHYPNRYVADGLSVASGIRDGSRYLPDGRIVTERWSTLASDLASNDRNGPTIRVITYNTPEGSERGVYRDTDEWDSFKINNWRSDPFDEDRRSVHRFLPVSRPRRRGVRGEPGVIEGPIPE